MYIYTYVHTYISIYVHMTPHRVEGEWVMGGNDPGLFAPSWATCRGLTTIPQSHAKPHRSTAHCWRRPYIYINMNK